MFTLSEWLQLNNQTVAEIAAPRISTVVVYLNGTRRWFLSQSDNWADYAKVTGRAHRRLNELLYAHGIRTLIQPILGYDLLTRGPDYFNSAIEKGLAEVTTADYRNWYRQTETQVTFYGNWIDALTEGGFLDVIDSLKQVVAETAHYTKQRLLFGVFADEGLDRIIRLAQEGSMGQALLKQYYGQVVGPVDVIIGSGQPAIWDLPLLNINKANLYFLQAPTFCLTQLVLRQILYDHLFQRTNDDEGYENVPAQVWRQTWQDIQVLGVGKQTDKGWIAL